MGYQWKDNIHIFHVAPISALCDQWFGYSKGQKKRPYLEHAKNQISLQFLRTLRLEIPQEYLMKCSWKTGPKILIEHVMTSVLSGHIF